MNGLTLLLSLLGFVVGFGVHRVIKSHFCNAALHCHRGWTQTEQIEFIFENIWNGKEVIRAAAWFRTVQYLKTGNYPQSTVREAQLRLYMLQHEGKRSDYSISTNGRLISITELGGVEDE